MNTQPIEIPTSEILSNNINDVKVLLKKYGAAIIPISNISTETRDRVLNKTLFYKTANAIFNSENQIEEPTMEEKLNPAKFKRRKVGDDASGFIHEYSTPMHHLLLDNSIVIDTLKSLYNIEGTIKMAPNRMRIGRKFKNDAKTLHIEGRDIFKTDDNGKIEIIDGEIATIIGFAGVRRFVFWDLSDRDLTPLYNYWKQYGSDEFTMIDPKFMNKHYLGCRRMVNVDCRETPHLIVWRETAPHEMAHSPSISAYLSPIDKYTNTIVKYTTSYQPPCYKGLTYHETNLLAICYQMGGDDWPSGKKIYQFCHPRVYKYFIGRIKKDYLSNGKFKFDLIKTGKIDQHSIEYQAKLRERNIKIPKIAFEKNMPPFVLDILSLSDNILKQYGFITE